MQPNEPADARTDHYETLFAANHDSLKNKIENALFCLTTLIQDEQTRLVAVAELNDALTILKGIQDTWETK